MRNKVTTTGSKSRTKKSEHVLQFLVILAETEPPIWRRILVPAAYSFWDLHVAIQDAMGWLDCHLHEFRVWNPALGKIQEIGYPDEDGYGKAVSASWSVPVWPLARDSGLPIVYTYDFGDNWRHVVAYEDMEPAEAGVAYPRCISGAGKCPPEDCGGIGGFVEFLTAMSNKRHPEHKSYVEWIGGMYDPKEFDPQKVQFDDPKKRLKAAFLG